MQDRKFIDTIETDEWEVETDTGWQDIVAVGKTVPYKIWTIQTSSFKLKCADSHIVFDENFNEIYTKDVKVGDKIQTENGAECVVGISQSEDTVNMYDLQLENGNRRFYTSGILSHNSIWLGNLAVKSMKLGYNTAFVSFEMKDKSVVKRMGANVLNVTMDEYNKFSRDKKKMKKAILKAREVDGMSMKVPGALHIKEFPTSSVGVPEVENYLLKLQETKDIKLRVVVVDYLSIMSNWRNPNTENTYSKVKQIAEDLRAMGQRNAWTVVSAQQLNRCLSLDTKVQVENRGVIEIKDLTEHDNILTVDGFKPVTKIYPIEKQMVYEVTTRSGKTIKCSGKHIFPTSKGYKKLKNIHIGDKLFSKNY